ncbi:MAG: helix-turn-helix domain-containing protein [Prevotellaceae bacterium]|nr:helix-turn-helix domain-containing protein [Prevotellaceae bacterium]
MWTERSNVAILTEIGSRLKEYRIRKRIQQKEMAEAAGVSLDTVVRLERGASISMEKLLRILRVLDMLENIESLVPEPPISPILLQKLKGKKRYRVRA